MDLPQNVRACLDALENAGFSAYAVGGCVRDWLLGLTPHDYDLCTAATPAQIRQVFANRQQVLAGMKHGTVGIVFDKEVVEITTFRTEGGYADNRHPDWVKFVTDIEADLARRDFTVNAMAFSPSRGLCDPFNGQADLKNKLLRAVGRPDDRFEEDALRILRGMRFASRFSLDVEPETWAAMLRKLELTGQLAAERVYGELDKLLMTASAADLIRFAPMITYVIPELAPAVGFDQHSPHHAYDLYTHIAYVTAAVPAERTLRWAALLHDVGKVATFTRGEDGRGHFYGHAGKSAEIADSILRRLKMPTADREEVLLLIENHMTPMDLDEKLLRRRIARFGADFFFRLLQLQKADMGSKGTGKSADTERFDALEQHAHRTLDQMQCMSLRQLAIDGNDLMAMGFLPGKGLGNCLNRLYEMVIDQKINNNFEELSAAAKEILDSTVEETL